MFIESYEERLDMLDREVRRLLRNAKLPEPDKGPVVRLQKPESQQRYVLYMFDGCATVSGSSIIGRSRRFGMRVT